MKKIKSVTAMLALAALLTSGAYAATASETTPATNTNQQTFKNNVPLMGPGGVHLGMNCDSTGMTGKHLQGKMGHDMNSTMGNHHQM